MYNEPILYCCSKNDPDVLRDSISFLKRQNKNILSLKELLRIAEGNADMTEACALLVCSDDESFLSTLPDICMMENASVAIFLQNMISDDCILSLQRCPYTPLFCDLKLLYRYSISYLLKRVHLQVLYTDTVPDKKALGVLRENRVRVLLSPYSGIASSISSYRVMRLDIPDGEAVTPSVALPVTKPSITDHAFAPYLAIRKEPEFTFTYQRTYSAAEGLYALTNDFLQKHTETYTEQKPSSERFVAALKQGFYPLVWQKYQKEPYLLSAWSGERSSFLAHISPAPCAWESLYMDANVLSCNILRCLYLKPLDTADKIDLTSFLQETCLTTFHFTNSFLQDFYRKDTTDSNERISLGNFLQERIYLFDLLCRESSRKNLYLSDIEDHALLLERFIRPILRIMEQKKDPCYCHNRLLMADGFSKVLLSEEACIEAYLEEMERERRNAEWLNELGKKENKR